VREVPEIEVDGFMCVGRARGVSRRSVLICTAVEHRRGIHPAEVGKRGH
jgi:hypothetical protein